MSEKETVAVPRWMLAVIIAVLVGILGFMARDVYGDVRFSKDSVLELRGEIKMLRGELQHNTDATRGLSSRLDELERRGKL